MSKKLLSLAIAICMVAAMLPMTFASVSAANEVYQFRYDFGVEGGAAANQSATQITYKTTSGKWAYNGASTVYASQAKSGRINLPINGTNEWVAFEINVPVSGVYDVRYDYREIGTSSATGDVYVFPAGTTLTPGIKFGTGANDIASTAAGKIATGIVYNNASGTTAGNYASYEDLSLTAGKNLVVFVATAGGATYPSALTLTTADATSTDYSDAYVGYVDVAKTTLDAEIAETTTATVSAYKMSDKSAIESGITFRSSNEAVATVAADGTVTAKKAGTTIISAVCTDPAVGNIFGTEITVTATTYKAAYTFDNRVILTGENSVAAVTDYAHTEGMWKYYMMNNTDGICYLKNNRLEIRTKDVGGYVAIAINVPKTDTYDVEYFHYGVAGRGGIGDVYIIPGGTSLSDTGAAKASGKKITTVDYASISNGTKASAGVAENISLTKGENILFLEITGLSANNTAGETYQYAMYPSALVLTNSAGLSTADELEAMYVGALTLDKAELKVGDEALATAEVYTADATADGVADGVAITSGITYASSNTAVATVDAGTGEITAVGEGEATISAVCVTPAIGSIIDAKLTVSKSDSQLLDEAFDADEDTTQYAPSVSATGVSGATAIEQADGTYKVSAPETKDGANFLYWVKGMSTNKRIVSLEKDFTYKPEGGDRNFLIPVYETATGAAKAEFYNANGQLIESNTTGAFPTAPSMPGFTSQGSWTCYNDGEVYDGTEEIELSGTMIFVANYDNTPVNVTVNGKSVSYGTLVECTADEDKGTFKWWTKKVNGVSEIVSTAENYSFYAWENCDVVGVYGTEATGYTGAVMKIVLDTFGTDSVMAEFIGFEGKTIVEKGMKWNGENIAMTTDKSQFTLSGAGTYTGYAIVLDGEGNYTLITDGEATVPEK